METAVTAWCNDVTYKKEKKQESRRVSKQLGIFNWHYTQLLLQGRHDAADKKITLSMRREMAAYLAWVKDWKPSAEQLKLLPASFVVGRGNLSRPAMKAQLAWVVFTLALAVAHTLTHLPPLFSSSAEAAAHLGPAAAAQAAASAYSAGNLRLGCALEPRSPSLLGPLAPTEAAYPDSDSEQPDDSEGGEGEEGGGGAGEAGSD